MTSKFFTGKPFILFCVLVVVLGAVLVVHSQKETFTPHESSVATAVAKFIRSGNKDYSDYLDLLPQHENTSDKLVSNSVFDQLVAHGSTITAYHVLGKM